MEIDCMIALRHFCVTSEDWITEGKMFCLSDPPGQARHTICSMVFHPRNVVKNQIETHHLFYQAVNSFIFDIS